MKFTSIILSLWLALAVHAQYVTGDYTATIGEVLDGLNQNKPVTPWGLSHAGFASSNSGMITNNYTGVVNLTNSANKFVGSFTVPEGATIKVTGISFPDATNGVWHFSYSRSSEAGSGTAYVFTNAIDPYYIIYDVSINSGWYYSSTPDSNGGQCNSGTTTNWLDWYGGYPINFQAKLGGVSIIAANPVPTIPAITLAMGSGGIVDNSADGYTGKQIRVSSDTAVGIYGNSTATQGVFGNSSAAEGVYGSSSAAEGVYGSSSGGIGVYGQSSAFVGVAGYSVSNDGTQGQSDGANGVSGVATSGSGNGVYGEADGSGNGVYGVSAMGHAIFCDGDLYAPSNSAAYFTFNSPTVSVVLGSNWTNTYGARIQLIVDGTLNMAVAGSTVLTFTNLTTAESHIVAGTTISIAGVTYFSNKELISSNNIIKYTAANTGTATTTLTKTTVKIQ
jgi:hypothetical protein